MKPLFFNIVKGVTVFCLCAAVLLLVLSFIALKTEDPLQYTLAFANAALIISAFIGGLFSTGGEVNRLVSGITSGLAATLIILLISLIGSSFNGDSFLRMALTVFLFTLGATVKKDKSKASSSVKKRKSIAKKYGTAK